MYPVSCLFYSKTKTAMRNLSHNFYLSRKKMKIDYVKLSEVLYYLCVLPSKTFSTFHLSKLKFSFTFFSNIIHRQHFHHKR